MSPLNPVLYSRLQAVFHKVIIANDGEQTVVSYRPDWTYRKGRLKAEVWSGGEEYRVNCPFCSDTRCRLYINYRWGVRDRRTRDDFLHLCNCFNEGCISTREQQKQLHAMVFPDSKYHGQVELPAKPVKVVAPTLIMFTMPLAPYVHELSPEHPACLYLAHRGLNVKELGRTYGVTYCEEWLSAEPSIREPRIIVPIYDIVRLPSATPAATAAWKLAGWQARLIDPPPTESTPKYLTSRGTKKSELLYGLPHAIHTTGPVVLVEGVFDAWKVGANGLAMFGKIISEKQCQLVTRALRGRPVVVMLDDDAVQEGHKVCAAIARARRMTQDTAPVVVAGVPAHHHDPGESSTAQIQQAVQLALADH